MRFTAGPGRRPGDDDAQPGRWTVRAVRWLCVACAVVGAAVGGVAGWLAAG